MQALNSAPTRAFSAATTSRPVQARRALRVSCVKVGEKAPDFSLPNQNGKTVKLSSYFSGFGKKDVIVYFYPRDSTPGCTKQAAAFNAALAQLKKAGAEVLGVSSDSVESHASFCSELGLGFQLLSDEGGAVRSLYKVPKDLFGLLDGRQTFVIGKDGIVKLVFNNQFAPEKHVEEALKVLQGAPVSAKA